MTFFRGILVGLVLSTILSCKTSSTGADSARPALIEAETVGASQVQILGNNGTLVRKRIHLKTRLLDGASLRPLSLELVKITFDGGEAEARTDANGVLIWSRDFEYDALHPNYTRYVFTILPMGNYRGTPAMAIPLAVSAGRESDPVADLRFINLAGLPSVVNQCKVTTKDFKLVPEGARYSVDKWLRLSVTRQLRVTFKIGLSQCQGLEKVSSDQFPIPGMALKLRVRVLAASPGAESLSGTTAIPLFEHVTTAVVDSKGEISPLIPLTTSFQEESFPRSRLFFAATVEPDGRDDIRPFAGFSVVHAIHQAASLSGSLTEAPALPGTAPVAETPKETPWNLFLDSAGIPRTAPVVMVSDSDADRAMRQFIDDREYESPPKVRARLRSYCALVADTKSCEKEPLAYFRTMAVELVEDVENGPATLLPTPRPNETFSLRASFFKESNETTRRLSMGKTTSRSTEYGTVTRSGATEMGGRATREGVAGEFEGGFKFQGNGVSARVYAVGEKFAGREWFTTRDTAAQSFWRTMEFETIENSIAIDERDRLDFLTSAQVSSERTDVAFQAKVRNCVVIAPVGDEAKGFVVKAYCRVSEMKRVSEAFFWLADDAATKEITARDRTWARAIRGEQQMREIRRALEDTTRKYLRRDRPPSRESIAGPFAESISSARRLEADWGVFPGLLRASFSPVYAIPPPPRLALVGWEDRDKDRRALLAKDCASRAVERGANAQRAAVYCGCIYEELAGLCEYADYQRREAYWDEQLEKQGIEARCRRLANEVRIP